jgi:hypothetical protein
MLRNLTLLFVFIFNFNYSCETFAGLKITVSSQRLLSNILPLYTEYAMENENSNWYSKNKSR